MKKNIINLVLALGVVTLGLWAASVSAEAATDTLEAEWSVSYDGKKIESTDYSSAIREAVKNSMPGDTITYTVNYTNNTDKATDWYLSSNVDKSLEDNSDVARNGGYAYSLTYNVDGTENPIFTSEMIGGSDIGLKQAVTSDDGYFYVGRLGANKSGTVTLSITLDGNSQTSDYMRTAAELSLLFGVEEVSVINVPHNNQVVYTLPNGTEIIYITDGLVALAGPKTGDSITSLVICGVALLVGIALILYYFKITKEQREEEVE